MTGPGSLLSRQIADGTLSWPEGMARPVWAKQMGGGWVGETWLAVLADGRRAVVKRCPSMAAIEADGLAALAAAGVPCPAVLGTADAVLVLERVGEGVPPPTDEDWARLGRAVAGMHQTTYQRFGWHRDNQAGRFVQPNPWTDDWPTFFIEYRVRIHLADPEVPTELGRRLERACDGPIRDRLPERPPPVLTHGDLWRGNTIAGRWVIDPEVSAADRELDLAYMQMSARAPFPEAFWSSYCEVAPIPDGFETRRTVLQLHHRLLQIRHFGAGQVPMLATALQELGW